MKKYLFLLLAICGLTYAATAQTPKPKPIVTVTIKTPNALCEACKTRIESYLKRYDGITEVTVYYRKGETKVKYYTDRINIEEIRTAINNCGYDADDELANEDAYNRLPRTCKKFEDGGGHPKPKTTPVPVPGKDSL